MTDTPTLGPVRILVVDDDDGVRDAVCDVLTTLGYAIDPVSGAREALERFRPGRYRLVVTDLAMPVMNGLQLARRLRALDPSLPILIFSGAFTPAEPGLEVGGVTIAHKPDLDALVRLIEHTLAES
jgi:CheY-like chemotaxis protein